jgi:predicted nucleotidyltransferase
MDITPEQASIVQKILNKNLPAPSKVWVFGSRTIKTKKEFSDLDLAIDSSGILPLSTIASLEYDFSESDLPYKVDLVDLNNINEIWRDRIIAEGVVFWEK